MPPFYPFSSSLCLFGHLFFCFFFFAYFRDYFGDSQRVPGWFSALFGTSRRVALMRSFLQPLSRTNVQSGIGPRDSVRHSSSIDSDLINRQLRAQAIVESGLMSALVDCRFAQSSHGPLNIVDPRCIRFVGFDNKR